MQTVYPDYYAQFRCTADKCPITCCQEWKISVDDDTLKRLKDESRIAFRYASKSGQVTRDFNPNGSRENIAGIFNEKRNILGMMPHPERASEPVLGLDHGRKIFESLIGA